MSSPTLLLRALFVVLPVASFAMAEDTHLDLAPFGRVMSWKESKGQTHEHRGLADVPAEHRYVGIQWDEERDIREVRATFDAEPPDGVVLQYWFRTWPPDAPEMPTIEDPMDDPWKGGWLDGHVVTRTDGTTRVFAFKPLAKDENPKADGLPGVNYRRTLKVRLVLPKNAPHVRRLEAYSDTTLDPLAIRVQFGAGAERPARWSGELRVYNGAIGKVRPWQFVAEDGFADGAWKDVLVEAPKGIIAEVQSARPSPPGSNDMTVITVAGKSREGDRVTPRTFSFSTLDLQHGPIYVPAMQVYITRADDPEPFSLERVRTGRKIRDRIPNEPEQTYERASREIPPLDPWRRQRGERVYLPLAADSSWQKFALEYGGDIFIDKNRTKAKGAELNRLRWDGSLIKFRLAAGREQPQYSPERETRVWRAEEFQPIVLNEWQDDTFVYTQETFVTLLEGPLDPTDPARSEQTPAVALTQLRIRNRTDRPQSATVLMTIWPRINLALVPGGSQLSPVGHPDTQFFGPILRPPAGAEVTLARAEAGQEDPHRGRAPADDPGMRTTFTVEAGSTQTVVTLVPFVSDLTPEQYARLAQLDYVAERERIATYWRELVNRTTRFTVPEPEFNQLARAVIPHLHMGVTKDPKSGLYMVPAAAYQYQVYMNESCFQTQLLDTLGDTARATTYLKTCTALQGSVPIPGNYQKPHDGVYHGAKVDDTYNYTANHYGLDQGTVLWSLARHYFHTGDRAWLRETLPSMLKAVEWIQRQRKLTRELDPWGQRPQHYGLLPAGHLEDNSDWGYWYSVNAYCVVGLLETAAAMAEIGHPEAETVRAAGQEYLELLRASVIRATEMAPVMRTRDGTYSPYVPTRAYQRFRNFGPLRVQYYSRWNTPNLPCYRLSATREVLYGPMILLNLEIFDPNEPIADWILDDWEDNQTLSSSGGFNVHGFTDDNLWFSQGGLVFQSNLQNPIWVYLYRRETPAAIRSIYNAFVSCLYPEVNAFTEEYREWRYGSGPFYKSPDEARFVNRLVDMLVMTSGREILLAAGVPRRWLTAPEGIHVERINTVLGELAFHIEPGREPGTLIARVAPPSRVRAEKIWLYLRLPKGKKPRTIRCGERELVFDAQNERVLLPGVAEPMEITVKY